MVSTLNSNTLNMTTTTKAFTLQDAIYIQSADLRRWKSILTVKAYRALLNYSNKNSRGIKNPYAIPRGQSLSNFVNRLSYEINN